MNKTLKTVKVDLFRSETHKRLFSIMRDHLSKKDQLEAFRRLMFMTEDQVIETIKQIKRAKVGEAMQKIADKKFANYNKITESLLKD